MRFTPLLWLIGLITPVAIASDVNACSEAYHGRAVDAVTGQPIQGAVIVVEWTKKAIVAMDGPMHVHKIVEGLTDAGGNFTVEACAGIDWNPVTFVNGHPLITIFEPGYSPWPLRSDPLEPQDFERMLREGGTVKLLRPNGSEDVRRFTTPTSVGLFAYPPPAHIPNLIRLLNIQRESIGMPVYPEP